MVCCIGMNCLHRHCFMKSLHETHFLPFQRIRSDAELCLSGYVPVSYTHLYIRLAEVQYNELDLEETQMYLERNNPEEAERCV